MGFLGKIEDLINQGLLWLMAKCAGLWHKLCPPLLLRAWHRCTTFFGLVRQWPEHARSHWAKLKEQKIKVNYQGVFSQALAASRTAFDKYKQYSPMKACWQALCAPFKFLAEWALTLKPAHFVILFVFTTASVFSVMGIVIQAKHILRQEAGSRAPASSEADSYQRPAYHKLNERELSFNNVKIPVYVTGVNELRALIIDFSVVTSNRATKAWLERNEFQMRDHLVHVIEPVLPSFPMTDEGRSMLAEKLKSEVNIFLQENAVEGQVTEARLVYILAH